MNFQYRITDHRQIFGTDKNRSESFYCELLEKNDSILTLSHKRVNVDIKVLDDLSKFLKYLPYLLDQNLTYADKTATLVIKVDESKIDNNVSINMWFSTVVNSIYIGDLLIEKGCQYNLNGKIVDVVGIEINYVDGGIEELLICQNYDKTTFELNIEDLNNDMNVESKFNSPEEFHKKFYKID